MAITALPEAPQRNNPTTFADKGDAFMAALPLFGVELNAVQADVNAKQLSAAASASVASAASASSVAAQSTAASAAGATLWTSGTGTVVGDVRYSPINQRIYRRTVAGNPTVDPSAAPGNWGIIDAHPPIIAYNATTAITMLTGTHYFLYNAGSMTATLPASPATGDRVIVSFGNGLFTNQVTSVGDTIMGVAAPMLIDSKDITITFRFINASWRIM